MSSNPGSAPCQLVSFLASSITIEVITEIIVAMFFSHCEMPGAKQVTDIHPLLI